MAENQLYDLAEQLDDLALQAFNELDSVADELALDLNQISAITRNGSTFLNQEPELIDILFSPSSVEQFEKLICSRLWQTDSLLWLYQILLRYKILLILK